MAKLNMVECDNPTNKHFYNPNEHDACPYCPKKSTKSNFTGTQVGTSSTKGGGFDKTVPFQSTSDPDKSTSLYTEYDDLSSGNDDLTKTRIVSGDSNNAMQNVERSQRKLVGFLVSYTIDPNGVFFPLYEGRNIIGKNKNKCSIAIESDSAISDQHMIVRYLNGKFTCSDELSSNGTYINDKELDRSTLDNGDIIKMGNTILKFMDIEIKIA